MWRALKACEQDSDAVAQSAFISAPRAAVSMGQMCFAGAVARRGGQEAWADLTAPSAMTQAQMVAWTYAEGGDRKDSGFFLQPLGQGPFLAGDTGGRAGLDLKITSGALMNWGACEAAEEYGVVLGCSGLESS